MEPTGREHPTSLITAIDFHNPGALIGHGAGLVRNHKWYGYNRILTLADRAYNYEKVENFHIPLRKAGAELVIDYEVAALEFRAITRTSP